jgi:hypothetical protein
MEVIVREPPQGTLTYNFWHLLRDGDAYFLYVYCEQSAAGIPIMVQAGGCALIPKDAFGCRIPAVFRVRFLKCGVRGQTGRFP